MSQVLYLGVSNNSKINCLIISGGIHVAPNFTPISLAVRSFGTTSFNFSTFILKLESSFANSSATFNFSLTLPDKYSSAVTQSLELPLSGILNITPCKPSIIFKKEFRWFYTYYSYTETYPPFSVLTKIPLDHYLTSEEQTLWFQGNDPAFQGKNGTELCDLLSKIEPKAYLWLNHNLFAESYAAIDRLLPDHPFKNRFEAARDSIFRLNQDKYDALDAKLPEMLDNYFKTDYFSRHGQRIDSLDDPELNHKLDSLDLYEITFQYELLLPGKILSSNTRQTTAGKLSWQLDAYRFLPQDYVMTAQSRAINVWAFALTALLLLTALYFIWKRK